MAVHPKYRIGYTEKDGAFLTPENATVGAFFGSVLSVGHNDTATKVLCKAYHGLRDRTVEEERKREVLKVKREAEARLRRFKAQNTWSATGADHKIYSVFHDDKSGQDYIMTYDENDGTMSFKKR